MLLNVEGLADPQRLRKARCHRAHLLATQGERIQRIAERCGVSIAVAKQFLNEPIIVRTRAEQSDLPNGVRKVKGGAYQARPWTVFGPGTALNVNLGLWHPEDYEGVREHRAIGEELAIAAAAFAARSFRSRMAWNCPRPDLWHVIQKLQAERRRGSDRRDERQVVPGLGQ